jgi:glycosyltransferase involved in cell wall biosynthesis
MTRSCVGRPIPARSCRGISSAQKGPTGGDIAVTDKRMTVLLDCRMATWTGIGRYTTGLVRALAQRDDLDLVLLTLAGDEPVVAEGEHVRCVSVRARPFSVMGVREIGRLAREVPFDVMHCLHFLTPFPEPDRLAVTIHDLTPIIVPSSMPNPVNRSIYRWLNRRSCHAAERVIVPSQSTAHDVARLLHVPENHICVTPEAADDFASGPVGTLPPDLADWLGENPYLFAMGNTKPHKDLPTLLNAFQRMSLQRPKLRLVLAGTETAGFAESILTRDALSRARFTGPISDDQLRALYSSAAVFVFPSRYEGFGLPPLEAMSFGAPCVVADSSSLPEVVGRSAIRFRAGDVPALAFAIGRMLSDEATRAKYEQAGRARAAEFSWARTAEATFKAYRDVYRA